MENVTQLLVAMQALSADMRTGQAQMSNEMQALRADNAGLRSDLARLQSDNAGLRSDLAKLTVGRAPPRRRVAKAPTVDAAPASDLSEGLELLRTLAHAGTDLLRDLSTEPRATRRPAPSLGRSRTSAGALLPLLPLMAASAANNSLARPLGVNHSRHVDPVISLVASTAAVRADAPSAAIASGSNEAMQADDEVLGGELVKGGRLGSALSAQLGAALNPMLSALHGNNKLFNGISATSILIATALRQKFNDPPRPGEDGDPRVALLSAQEEAARYIGTDLAAMLIAAIAPGDKADEGVGGWAVVFMPFLLSFVIVYVLSLLRNALFETVLKPWIETKNLWGRTSIPIVVTHFTEYVLMASFMGIYKSCKCLPDESTGGSSDGTSTDTSPASNTPGLRGFSESMYFSMTTQTTVGYGDITVDKDKPWCIVAVSTQMWSAKLILLEVIAAKSNDSGNGDPQNNNNGAGNNDNGPPVNPLRQQSADNEDVPDVQQRESLLQRSDLSH